MKYTIVVNTDDPNEVLKVATAAFVHNIDYIIINNKKEEDTNYEN